MKALSFFALASLVFTLAAQADQTVSYPRKDPLIAVGFPDDWKLQWKKGVLYANPDGNEDIFLSLAPMETTADDLEGAVKESREFLEEDFKNLKYEDVQKGESGGAGITVFNAKGEDEDGEANLNVVIISPPGEKTLYELKCVSTQEAFEAHGDMVSKIISSIRSLSAAGAVQTYSYPDAEAPTFTINFPADWKLEKTDEGAYVESPDQLVAMNVLFIDTADADIAVEKMKEKVGEKYKSIEWNVGGEPSVAKDDALGVTATFDNGVAMDENGVKYSVNFAKYVRRDGDKFLLLIGQNPLSALEKHGDAIDRILQSIKVK